MIDEDKYFFRVDNNQKPVALYRLRPPFIPELWYQGQWKSSDRLLDYLQEGFVDLDTCSVEQAKEFKPEAFEEE